MKNGYGEKIIDFILKMVASLWLKIFIKAEEREAYLIESERYHRSIQYRCGHQGPRNFVIYTVVPEGYLPTYCTHNEGDVMCIACTINDLENDANGD
jgi:hypothetical protein